MNPRAPLDPRLLEALSAYLDGRLEGAEKAALEERLPREEDLRLHLAELRTVKESLRALPSLKPPRPLTLTPSQAGEAVRRSGWFSSRSMALGSALAVMAFVVVLSADLLSGGISLGASSPRVESFAAATNLQAADQAAPKNGQATAPSVAAQPPGEPASDGCGESSGADAAVERCGLGGGFEDLPAPQPVSLPSFRTLAPYLECFLGLAAVILAAIAVAARRRIK